MSIREQRAYDVINMPIPPQRQQHSTGTNAGLFPDDENSYPTSETIPPRRRAPLVDDYDDAPNSQYPRSSIRRSSTQAVTRQPAKEIHVIRHGRPDPSRLPVPAPQKQVKDSRVRIHLPWYTWLFLVLIVMVFGSILASLLFNLIHTTSDNWTYGNPRTAQYDKDVGHGGNTHFIAVNLQGHIIVTEITNNDVKTAKVYSIIVITGDNAGLAPVTLSFVQEDNNPNVYDMVVTVAGGIYPWVNTGTEFKQKQSS